MSKLNELPRDATAYFVSFTPNTVQNYLCCGWDELLSVLNKNLKDGVTADIACVPAGLGITKEDLENV